MRFATCGTLESNDCLITVRPHDTRAIEIESIVYKQFGDAIRNVIEETLDAHGIQKIYVHIHDKGALDYAIRARLITALMRLGVISDAS